MRKKCFTVVEVLMASGIFSFIIIIGMGIASLMSSSLFTGQVESTNRSELNSTIFYITREIQSAEGVKIEESGKKLSIKKRGSSDYSLCYEICDDYPVGTLSYKGKRLLDLNYGESQFSYSGDAVLIEWTVMKNNTDVNQISRKVELTVTPRSEEVVLE